MLGDIEVISIRHLRKALTVSTNYKKLPTKLKVKKLRLLIFLCVFISVGCKPLKNLSPKTYSIERITKTEYTKLDGTYSNNQDTVFGKIIHDPGGLNENNRRLLDRLFIFYPGKAEKEGTTVNLKFTSSKKATVNVYRNGTVIFSRDMKGKIKNDYFYVRPKTLILPLLPIMYVHNFERVRIGKVGNNILIDQTINSFGFLLIAGGSSDRGRSTSIYSRLKE